MIIDILRAVPQQANAMAEEDIGPWPRMRRKLRYFDRDIVLKGCESVQNAKTASSTRARMPLFAASRT